MQHCHLGKTNLPYNRIISDRDNEQKTKCDEINKDTGRNDKLHYGYNVYNSLLMVTPPGGQSEDVHSL